MVSTPKHWKFLLSCYACVFYLCNASSFRFLPKNDGGFPLSNHKRPPLIFGGGVHLTCDPETLLNVPTYSDLTASLQPRLGDDESVYRDALQIIASLEASPSCSRIATTLLLKSCRSMDGSKQDAENKFDDVKSIYAAQLAICEIANAGLSIPQSCNALAPSKFAKASNLEALKQPTKTSIGQCLQALESRPQWWTSYSNSRQNAIIMCQATRIDIDKGYYLVKSR